MTFVGGGNSFRLLKALQRTGLVGTIRDRVWAGALRYLGSSAGTNMARPSLRTRPPAARTWARRASNG